MLRLWSVRGLNPWLRLGARRMSEWDAYLNGWDNTPQLAHAYDRALREHAPHLTPGQRHIHNPYQQGNNQ